MKNQWKNRIVRQETVSITDIVPNAKNWRKHPAKQQTHVKGSLDTLGWVRSVLVNLRTSDEWEIPHRNKKTVIDGHLRLDLALKNGEDKIPVEYVDLSPDEEKIALASIDPLAAMAETDEKMLDLLLSSIDCDVPEITDMLGDIGTLEGLEPDEPEPQDSEPQISRAEELRKEWGTELGQMWQCGDHRVICGDCTDPEVVGMVMGDEKADMVFTDPPYGIGVDIANDNLSLKKLEEWNGKWLKNIPTIKNTAMICYHSPRTFPSLLIPAMKEGWFFERMLWLTRPDKFPVNSWNGWVLISQAILLFSKGKPEYLKISPAEQDVYKHTAAELGEHSGHPTEKILGHCQSVMGHFAAPVILDPFLGSGTTMIACENLGRKCRGCEISPEYVAVILERFKTTFNKQPVLLGDD